MDSLALAAVARENQRESDLTQWLASRQRFIRSVYELLERFSRLVSKFDVDYSWQSDATKDDTKELLLACQEVVGLETLLGAVLEHPKPLESETLLDDDPNLLKVYELLRKACRFPMCQALKGKTK